MHACTKLLSIEVLPNLELWLQLMFARTPELIRPLNKLLRMQSRFAKVDGS